MKKKLVVLATSAAALVVFGPGVTGTAGAACDSQTYNSPVLAGPAGPSNTYVYGAGDQANLTGYVGVAGDTGYIEGNGSADGTGQIDGGTSNGAVSGRVTVNGAASSACVNDNNVGG